MRFQNIRPIGFSEIPLVTKNLLIINVLLFVFSNYIIKSVDLNRYLDLYYFTFPEFKPHQIITHMFMHANWQHLLFNMLGLYFIGPQLESLWGSKRFINFYLLCGLFAAGVQLVAMYLTGEYGIMLGASGAIYGLLGGMAILFPNTEVYLYMLIPIKMKYLVAMIVVISLYSGYRNSLGDNTAHFAHLGGLLMGIIIVLIWNKTNKRTFY